MASELRRMTRFGLLSGEYLSPSASTYADTVTQHCAVLTDILAKAHDAECAVKRNQNLTATGMKNQSRIIAQNAINAFLAVTKVPEASVKGAHVLALGKIPQTTNQSGAGAVAPEYAAAISAASEALSILQNNHASARKIISDLTGCVVDSGKL